MVTPQNTRAELTWMVDSILGQVWKNPSKQLLRSQQLAQLLFKSAEILRLFPPKAYTPGCRFQNSCANLAMRSQCGSAFSFYSESKGRYSSSMRQHDIDERDSAPGSIARMTHRTEDVSLPSF